MHKALLFTAILVVTTAAQAEVKTLRLLTWEGHAPQSVVKLFTKKTGIKVRVTISNNEDMFARLLAIGGAGYDLAQPGQDQIVRAQSQFNLFKPIDLKNINTSLFNPALLEITRQYTTVNDKTFGIPHVWGTSGLVLNTKKASMVHDYTDLCSRAVKNKASYRLQRPTLIAFAFAMGMDPFAAYEDKALYQSILDTVEKRLIACSSNINYYWSSGEALRIKLRSGAILAAMAWDSGGWKLNRKRSRINFLAPKSGALGWIDTFAIPRNGKADAAAYAWINFIMQAKIAAMITAASGNYTASRGADAFIDAAQRKRFKQSFPENSINDIHWYPPMPIGLERLENRTLQHIKAAIARQQTVTN